jgi:hypothetical protein
MTADLEPEQGTVKRDSVKWEWGASLLLTGGIVYFAWNHATILATFAGLSAGWILGCLTTYQLLTKYFYWKRK